MKKNILVIAALIFALTALLISVGALTGWVNAGARQQTVRWGNPMVVSYQGQIWEDGTPYDGEGYFKFAIVNGSGDTQVWSIDGYEPPAGYVPLNVENGFFSVLLGDITLEGMDEPLPPEVFYETDRMIRVWFSTDPDAETWEYTQMPDQAIAAVPYAYTAGIAAESQRLGPYYPTDFQLLVTGTCSEGQMVQEILWDGSVVCGDPPEYEPPTYTASIIEEGNFGFPPSIAIGIDDLGLIAYFDGSADDLKVAHCDDTNCTSATISTLDTNGGASPSLAIGADGLGLISYLDSGNLKVAHCSNDECTTATTSTITSGVAGSTVSLAIGADGYGIIVYEIQSGPYFYLQVAHCSNTNCSAATTYTIIPAEYPMSPKVIIGTDSLPLISYHDWDIGEQNLKVVHCENLACSLNSIHEIDYLGIVGIGNNISIGEDGLGIISHVDRTNDALKVAHCQDVECTTASSLIIDRMDPDFDLTNGLTSNVIGRDGLALVAYYVQAQNGNKVLKIAHCSNLFCSYADIAGVPSPEAATYPSIVIGADGLGLIAAASSENLMVIHCSNELCIPTNFEETP